MKCFKIKCMKREMDDVQIEQTMGHPYICANDYEKNRRHWITYKKMPPKKKATLLK